MTVWLLSIGPCVFFQKKKLRENPRSVPFLPPRGTLLTLLGLRCPSPAPTVHGSLLSHLGSDTLVHATVTWTSCSQCLHCGPPHCTLVAPPQIFPSPALLCPTQDLSTTWTRRKGEGREEKEELSTWALGNYTGGCGSAALVTLTVFIK